MMQNPGESRCVYIFYLVLKNSPWHDFCCTLTKVVFHLLDNGQFKRKLIRFIECSMEMVQVNHCVDILTHCVLISLVHAVDRHTQMYQLALLLQRILKKSVSTCRRQIAHHVMTAHST